MYQNRVETLNKEKDVEFKMRFGEPQRCMHVCRKPSLKVTKQKCCRPIIYLLLYIMIR